MNSREFIQISPLCTPSFVLTPGVPPPNAPLQAPWLHATCAHVCGCAFVWGVWICVLCCVVFLLCYVVLCYVTLCCVVSFLVLFWVFFLCHFVQCFSFLFCCVVLCCVVLCCVVLCCVVLCCVGLRCVALGWLGWATQHNTTQHNTTQHNTTQHNTTQRNTTQYNTTQHKIFGFLCCHGVDKGGGGTFSGPCWACVNTTQEGVGGYFLPLCWPAVLTRLMSRVCGTITKCFVVCSCVYNKMSNGNNSQTNTPRSMRKGFTSFALALRNSVVVSFAFA